MSLIRYHETERLFTAWPSLDAIFESLLVDLNAIRVKGSTGVDEDYIYNMCVGNKITDYMPPTVRISDSTYRVAANYAKAMRYDQRELRNELKGEVFEISQVLEKLQIAFRRLTPLQRCILELCYWDGKTWAEIMDYIKTQGQFYSKRQAQEQRRIGIEKMTRIMKVSIEVYEEMMKLVEGSFTN